MPYVPHPEGPEHSNPVPAPPRSTQFQRHHDFATFPIGAREVLQCHEGGEESVNFWIKLAFVCMRQALTSPLEEHIFGRCRDVVFSSMLLLRSHR